MKKLLRALCSLDGVAGYEDEVRNYIQKHAARYADDLLVDALGNLIVFKKGEQRRKKPMMVCAHMDEVGFLVQKITDNGMLKLVQAGSIDPRVLVGRRMRVGPDKVPGVISIKAIHLTTAEERKSAPQLESLYIDIGAKDKAEAEQHVSVGDPAVFDSAFYEMGEGCVKGKAIDDRVGCAVMMKLVQEPLAYDTWFVFSTNEEIGGRGAAVAAQRIQPGACLVIEGTTAGDMPDVPQHCRSTSQRHGAVVSLMDRGTIYDRDLLGWATEAANEQGVQWQYRQSANGSTDAAAIHLACEGARAFGLAAPVRYIHSACNLLYLPDAEQVLNMARIVLEEAGKHE